MYIIINNTDLVSILKRTMEMLLKCHACLFNRQNTHNSFENSLKKSHTHLLQIFISQSSFHFRVSEIFSRKPLTRYHVITCLHVSDKEKSYIFPFSLIITVLVWHVLSKGQKKIQQKVSIWYNVNLEKDIQYTFKHLI